MIAIIDYHYGSKWTKYDIYVAVFYMMMSVGTNYYHSVTLPYIVLTYIVVLTCIILCHLGHLLDHYYKFTIKYVNNSNETMTHTT